MAKKSGKPKKFMAGHLNWKIKWVKNIPKEPDCKGLTDTGSQTIWVCTQYPVETQRTILLHEVLHALWWSHHINPSLNDFEEDVVSALAGALVAVVSEHDSLRAFLFRV